MFKSNDFRVNVERLKYISSFYGSEAKALIQALTNTNVFVPIGAKKPSWVMPGDLSQASWDAPIGMCSSRQGCRQLF